jgi:hypothetical protein
MLLDTGKCGSLREIEMTDIRSVLNFMLEYHRWKSEANAPSRYTYGDQTDFA